MSIKEQFEKLARAAGGSFKTVSDRARIMNRVADHLKEQNIQIRDIEHLKSRHIESYIQSRHDNGIKNRTIQNELSKIRVTLREAGRETLANSERLSTKAMGADNASRDGTHRAMPDHKYQDVHARLGEIDAGAQAAAELQRWLGLRSEEAVQSNKSLETWMKQLNEDKTIRVIYGTKTGRPRDVSPADIGKAREAIKNALEIAKSQNGKLIDKPNLEKAMDRYSYAMRTAGAVGEFSPHSLRYAFANDSIERYEAQGYNHKDALALTSMDLGHGDGRGRYIEQVYSKQ